MRTVCVFLLYSKTSYITTYSYAILWLNNMLISVRKMARIIMLLYITALFVALTPGILLTLPAKGSKLLVAIVHAVLFTIILYFTYKHVRRLEGFEEGPVPDCSQASPTKFCTCPTGYQYLVDNNTCIPSVEGFTSGYEDLPICTNTYKGPCNPRARMSDDASVF
jgi:hypothetical protein